MIMIFSYNNDDNENFNQVYPLRIVAIIIRIIINYNNDDNDNQNQVYPIRIVAVVHEAEVVSRVRHWDMNTMTMTIINIT